MLHPEMRLMKVGWGVFTIMRTRHWKSVIPALLQQSVRLCPRKFLSFLSTILSVLFHLVITYQLYNWPINRLYYIIILIITILLLYYSLPIYRLYLQSIVAYLSTIFCPTSPIYRLYSVLLRLFIDSFLFHLFNDFR